jgi:hypothetical protein
MLSERTVRRTAFQYKVVLVVFCPELGQHDGDRYPRGKVFCYYNHDAVRLCIRRLVGEISLDRRNNLSNSSARRQILGSFISMFLALFK